MQARYGCSYPTMPILLLTLRKNGRYEVQERMQEVYESYDMMQGMQGQIDESFYMIRDIQVEMGCNPSKSRWATIHSDERDFHTHVPTFFSIFFRSSRVCGFYTIFTTATLRLMREVLFFPLFCLSFCILPSYFCILKAMHMLSFGGWLFNHRLLYIINYFRVIVEC